MVIRLFMPKGRDAFSQFDGSYLPATHFVHSTAMAVVTVSHFVTDVFALRIVTASGNHRESRNVRDEQPFREILAERGVAVDHASLNRWIVRYLPLIAAQTQLHKGSTARSCRVDETYIKVCGQWTYLYRAVDREGQTLDVMRSERRNLGAARRFFKNAIASNGVPHKIVIDKSEAIWLVCGQ